MNTSLVRCMNYIFIFKLYVLSEHPIPHSAFTLQLAFGGWLWGRPCLAAGLLTRIDTDVG